MDCGLLCVCLNSFFMMNEVLIYHTEPQKEYLISSQGFSSTLTVCIYFADVRAIDEEGWQQPPPLNSAVS